MTYDDAIKHFGSQAKLARALNVRQPSVYEWRERGIPLVRQYQIERITLGRLRVDDPLIEHLAFPA